MKDASITLLSCAICGAVIGIKAPGQDAISETDVHLQWHSELEQKLAKKK
jgi:hypothetical protein